MNHSSGTATGNVRPMTTAKMGLVALGAAGVLGLFQLLVLGSPDSAPVGVVLTTSGLGLVTLVGAAAAWRGSRAGLLVAVAARVLDSALGIPAFFLDAPAWVVVLIAAMLVLTVVGVVLVAPDLRRGKAKAVAS
jgi:hypothetical protein